MARILAALSGGVDSSVAAAILVGRGHDVVGVSLKLADESGGVSRCCSAADIRDARRVAAHLGIPHYVLDEEEAFEREVVAPFLQGYREGRTPNPCVGCNSRLKFGRLLALARAIGAAHVATGHYARILREEDTGRARIHRGADRSKDQSYFLFDLDEEQREAALFPLGGMTKDEVRSVAGRLGLPVAGKPESQDLCFVPRGDVRGYLSRRLGPAPESEIRHVDGRSLGRSTAGAVLTVGQRKGIGIASGEPLYVLDVDPASREVVVGSRDDVMTRELYAGGVRLHDPTLAGRAFRAEARIRSRHEGAPALVEPAGPGRPGLRVTFDEPQAAVTPGQAVVLYDGDRLAGGAWIERRPVAPRLASPVDCGFASAERA